MPSQQQQPPCPQCGGEMEYRLGEFECASCGYREPLVKPKDDRSSSGPGFRKEQWGGPTQASGHSTYGLPGQYQAPTSAPPPPPPGSAFYGQQSPYNSPYDSAPSYGTLDLEKKIYFGLQAVVYGVAILLLTLSGGFLASFGGQSGLNAQESGMVGGMIAGGIIGSLIGLAIQWYVLFGDQVWLKWCCGGCAAFSILGAIVMLFIPTAATMGGGQNPVSMILQLGMSGWYVSILWRDIQRLQS